MPRGEKATYESAFAGAKRFLVRRSADAREAHVGRFLAEVKAMGPAVKMGPRKKVDGGASASPAPKKKVAAKAKAKKGKRASKRAAQETGDENSDGDGEGAEE